MMKLSSLIERRITTGNLATMATIILAWAIGGAVWYTQVSGHVADSQIHQPVEVKQRMIDDRVHLIVDPQAVEVNRRLDGIERNLGDNTKLLYEIKGRLPEKK